MTQDFNSQYHRQPDQDRDIECDSLPLVRFILWLVSIFGRKP